MLALEIKNFAQTRLHFIRYALGPLLFLIYVKEMFAQVTYGKLLQSADDTALICSGMTQAVVRQYMSIDLSQLAVWIKNRKMQLNISKCSVM